MHVILDCRSIHSHMAGIGLVAVNLVKYLAHHSRGHQISALIGANPSEGLEFDGISVVQVDAAMVDEPFEQFGLPGVLEDMRADIYINLSFSLPVLKTITFQISVIHDVVFEDKSDWVEPHLCAYLQRWSRFAAIHADSIVTVSDYSRDRITTVYGVNRAQITRIYNGIPAQAFLLPSTQDVFQALCKYGLSSKDSAGKSRSPYVLYLGSTEPKKGTPELLSAFARLISHAPKDNPVSPLQLFMAGGKSGPAYDLTDAIVKTGFADRIRHVGYVEEKDKKALLAGCSLFVYPSRYEGFGLPPLEAMALGIPCVVNNATSIPEIVGDAAIKVDVCDQEAFVRAMEKGLFDREFRERAKVAGPERARMFTWERAADQYLDLCESLMKTQKN